MRFPFMIQQIYQILFVGLFLYSQVAEAQEERLPEERLPSDAPYTLSVEEDMLNLKVQDAERRDIYAASKKLERTFESAVTAYIITADEIRFAGATSIGEALRLAPGLIVRQKTNGFYDVHLRSAVSSPSFATTDFNRTTVLLTLDEIPMNDWYTGGILWEAIPVGLHNIERIEVINTPHTVLFGPNAAAGLINIVTTTPEETRIKVKANLQGGTSNTFAHRASASFGASDALRFRVSGFFNSRQRFQDNYYVLSERKYVNSDSLQYFQATANSETYQFSSKALENFGVNGYAVFQPNSNMGFEAMIGTQQAEGQSVFKPLEQIAITYRKSQSNVFSLRSKLYGVNTHMSYQNSFYDYSKGYPGFAVDMKKFYVSTEYDITKKRYGLQLGGNFQQYTYQNQLASRIGQRAALKTYENSVLLGKTRLFNAGAYASQHFYLLDRQWKVMATGRGDYLSMTDNVHLSYQLASTYRIGDNNILRAVVAKGIGDITAQTYLRLVDTLSQTYQFNQNLSPLTTQTYELGFRTTPYSDLLVDLVVFENDIGNTLSTETTNGVTVFRNTDGEVRQRGATVDVNWLVNKFRLKAFLTLQQTRITGSSTNLFYNTLTPTAYGGVSGSYQAFLNKLKVNTNVYFFGKSDIDIGPENIVIPRKTIADLKVSYNIWGEHSIYFNGRNILNNNQVESPFADKIPGLYLLGVELIF